MKFSDCFKRVLGGGQVMNFMQSKSTAYDAENLLGTKLKYLVNADFREVDLLYNLQPDVVA